MPQLEISTYTTQIFWLFVSFISFWFIMAKCIIPKIAQTVEARKRKYEDFIKKAEKINKKALTSIQHYEETIAAAKKKASERIEQTKKTLKEFIADKEDKLSQQLKQKITQNEEILHQERAETSEKLEELSQIAAVEILKKLEITSITASEVKKTMKGD